MELPVNYEDVTETARTDIKDWRKHLIDSLKDCCNLLGKEPCFSHLIRVLDTQLTQFNQFGAVQGPAWHPIEATLYCIRFIASEIDIKQSDNLGFFMRSIGRFPANAYVRYTSTLIVGRYASWFNLNQQEIPSILQFIVVGFGDAVVAASSALAFKYFCHDCSKILAASVEQLLEIYERQSGNPVLDNRDCKELVEGCCSVIACLPRHLASQCLWRLLAPILQQLDAANQSKNEADAFMWLSRVKTVFRFSDVDALADGEEHPLLAVFVQAWTVIDRSFDAWYDNSYFCDKLCLCVSEAISSLGKNFYPVAATVIARATTLFKATHESALLSPLLSKISKHFAQFVRRFARVRACVCVCAERV